MMCSVTCTPSFILHFVDHVNVYVSPPSVALIHPQSQTSLILLTSVWLTPPMCILIILPFSFMPDCVKI